MTETHTINECIALVGGPKQNEQDEEAGHVPRVNDLLLPLFARLPVTTNEIALTTRKIHLFKRALQNSQTADVPSQVIARTM